jgi:hypothetical protein
MSHTNAWVATYASAVLLFLIVRSSDLSTLAKSDAQRTRDERVRVSRGLMRSMVLELLVFVPASASLLLLLLPLFPKLTIATDKVATHAIVGVVSYGFPFSAVRRLVTRMALSTLKEFASLHPEGAEPKDDE